MMNLRRHVRGFTVIELLVVLLVVAMLAALLYSAILGALDRAKGAQCLGNLRSLSSALFLYAGENRNYLPPAISTQTNGSSVYWTSLVAPYLDLGQQQPGQQKYRCPARPAFAPKNGNNYTYGINYGEVSGQSLLGIPDANYVKGRIRPLGQLGASTYIMADAEGKSVPMVYYPGPEGNWPLTADKDGDGIIDSSATVLAPFNGIAFVHGSSNIANFIFADGSARGVTKVQWATNSDRLWGPAWP